MQFGEGDSFTRKVTFVHMLEGGKALGHVDI
jgi:hypothetical protein